MNKKMNKLVLLSVLMIAIIGTFGTVSAAEPLTVELIADGGNVETAFPVGVVEVTNDDEYLYVTYTTTDGWLLNETHLHIANESEYIPQTKKGNPKVGKFDYSSSTVHEYIISLEGYNEGDEVIIAAHAAVQLFVELNPITGENIFRYESAWGEGDEFNEDRNWAMFITYEIPLTVEEPVPA